MQNFRSKRRRLAVSLLGAALLLALGAAGVASAQTVLDARTLTKYIDPLPIPGVMPMAGPNYYEIGMYETTQPLHGELPPTTVWGYGTSQATASYPGATIVATRGVPIQVKWTNNLPMTHLLDDAIDHTLHMAMPAAGVPAVVHLHGGEVEPGSDGGPDSWYTQGFAEKGPGWQYETFTYPNNQRSTTLFYHDHALGMTRLNLYAGLAGGYVIVDPANDPPGLPSGNYDVPLVLQDRMFTTDGQLWYPNEGDNEEHPVWTPEFFGDAVVINGKAWPYFNVEPRKYRFRMVNGSNSRVYSMSLNDRMTGSRGPAFVQIGTDGGLLAEPVVLNEPAVMSSPRLVLATGERADVVIDFSAYPAGTEFILRNVAKAPYPNGEAVDPQGPGQMMLLRVVEATGPDESVVPANLATFERLANPTVTRTLTLNELMGMEGPLGAFLNGQAWNDPTTEKPALGTTEMWEVVNMTGDTHPIHLHLVQFQLLNRQKVNLRKYEKDWSALNPVFPAAEIHALPAGGYLKGKPMPADPNERGWKDTFRMNPGEVTRILVRFAPQDEPAYSFDATAEPGYVWHCHIIEHEDNEMMRRMEVQPASMAAVVAGDLAARSAAGEAAREAAPVSFRNAASNPASSGGVFRFRLESAGPVELDLFSVDGRLVKRLASGRYERGEHSVSWTRTDESGRDLASGVYLVRFRGDGAESSKKLVVIP